MIRGKDLRVGDVFLGANGELSTLTNLVRVEQEGGIAVFNFTVEGNHNYFILAKEYEYGQTCVLVHNAKDCGTIAAEATVQKALRGIDLRGKSFNAGRKLLEGAGFKLAEITKRGRKVFTHAVFKHIKISFDSGKALWPGQKVHWHIQDANFYFSSKGIVVPHESYLAHIRAF